MLAFIQETIYIYAATALLVCAAGWLFEKLRVFPHAVHFCARVGRCACFAVAAVIISLILRNTALATYPSYSVTIENGMMLVVVVAIWYSLIHIHASYVQISAMWKVYKRFEAYVYSHINDMDRERYAAFAEELKADELFSNVDPQYYELYDAATVKLALDLNIM